MKILLDVDGVLADFASAYLDFQSYTGPRDDETIGTWESILDITQTTSDDIAEAFRTVGFCIGIKAYPWAEDFVLSIEGLGHEVVFCTAVGGWEREEWISSRWPNRKIVQTRNKELLATDDSILIDDWEEGIANYPGAKILFPRPWNSKRGGSWEDVVKELIGTNALTRANALVNGNRNDDYGHPYYDFKRTAGMMSALFDFEFKPSDIPLMMNCVKMSRHRNRQKRDNIVDGIGYWATLEMVEDKQKQLEGAV